MREKILNLLKTDDHISGEKIAEILNVSRTAVWKQINSLKKDGYEIDSIKNKGYRLLSRPDIPFSEEISKNLCTEIIGNTIIYFPEISSTNLHAKKLIGKNAKEGTIIISDVQKQGRGRKDRSWSSPIGGLWFSTILYPNLTPQNGMIVTMVASVAITRGIEETLNITPVIKWPNDLLIDNKKVCGILTELDAEMDKINYMIVGIGLNVNNKIDKELKKIAISLKQKTGSEISRVELLQSILKHFDRTYCDLLSGKYENIRNLWLSYSNIIGKKIQVEQSDKVKITGKVVDIDESGCLILKKKDGNVKIFSGDVTFL